MSWYVFAVIAALVQSFQDLITKQCVSRLVAWWEVSVSALLLAIIIPLVGIPSLGEHFWWAVGGAATLDFFAIRLYMQAMKHSEMTLIIPLQMFTPLFLLITAPVLLGEVPSAGGAAGVVLIVLGSYMLNLRAARRGFFAPFAALFEDSGARKMFVCAVIWSIAINLHKIGMQESSPVFYFTMLRFLMAAGLSFTVLSSLGRPHTLRWNFSWLLPVSGVLAALGLLVIAGGMQTGYVAYVFAVKRTSVLLSMCLAVLILKEVNLKERYAGAGVMIAGVLLTSLS